jgi:hypothetical protein
LKASVSERAEEEEEEEEEEGEKGEEEMEAEMVMYRGGSRKRSVYRSCVRQRRIKCNAWRGR